MKLSASSLFSMLLVHTLSASVAVSAGGTQFSSHIALLSPGHSYSHGVGDPVSVTSHRRHAYRHVPRNLRRPPIKPRHFNGYPKTKPSIPFTNEDTHHLNSISNAPWIRNSYKDIDIPVLPPSPYKVDSPDPESSWPDGLYLPPISPHRFTSPQGKYDNDIEQDIRNVLSWDLF